MQNRVFHTAKVKSSVLQKYISYYYFDCDLSSESIQRIVYYPNTENSLTIYKNSELEFVNNFSVAKHTREVPYFHCYGGVLKQFRVANMNTPYEKIGIVFKPYGINTFLKVPLTNLLSKSESLRFPYFEETMKSTLDLLYESDSIDDRVDLLEGFFLSELKTEQDSLITKALEIIESSVEKIKVSELIYRLAVNPKTLNRKFQKHLCCSVKDYIEVVQFRKSFNYYLKTNKTDRLVDLAYRFNYYDQADFIHKFKKITGLNPSLLFNGIEQFGEEDLFWTSRV